MNLPLLKAIDVSNQTRYKSIVSKIEMTEPRSTKIAVLGLTYKAGTDDVRCSPSIQVIKLLLEKGFEVNAHDPQGIEKATQELGNSVNFYDDIYAAAANTGLCLIMTEWDEYKHIDAKKLASVMQKKKVYDLRRVINKDDFVKSGFKVVVVGYKGD